MTSIYASPWVCLIATLTVLNMNERIQQLVRQAGLDDADFPIENWDNVPLAKFAELIVRECMDIARQVGNISEPDDFALDRCYEIEQRIQDRFGVEE